MLTKQERELVKQIMTIRLCESGVVSFEELTAHVVEQLLKDVFDAHKIDVSKLKDEVNKIVHQEQTLTKLKMDLGVYFNGR